MAKIQVFKIDEEGLYIEPVIIEEDEYNEMEIEEKQNLINSEIPEGLHQAKWDFTNRVWIDAKSQEERLIHLRNIKIISFNSLCNEEIREGFTSASTGFFFEFEEHDQANFTQQAIMLLNDPTIEFVSWKTANQGIQNLTREQFFTIMKESEGHKRAKIGKYWQKKGELEMANTEAEIDAVLW